MKGEAKTRPDWLNRTSLMIGTALGAVSLIGAVGALLRDDGPSKAERYRSTLAKRVCGDLKAAVQTSQPGSYAGEGGLINKQAWLKAMDTAAGYLTKGRETLRLPPPAELQTEWAGTSKAWSEFLGFWNDYRQATSALPEDELTVFTYPPPEWAQRLNAANASFGTSLEKLLQTSCTPAAPQSDIK